MATFSTEQRDYTVDAKLIPLGYQQITSLSSVQGLSPPPQSRVALIQAVTQPVRWRDDGVDPDANTGMVLEAARDMLFTSDLTAVRFIETAASAEINVSYYH